MHIQPIVGPSFGKVYIQEETILKDENGNYLKDENDDLVRHYETYEAKPLNVKAERNPKRGNFDKEMDFLIAQDFNNVGLRKRFNELIEEQRYNPVDIIISSFYCTTTEPEKDFLSATVNGRRVFKQRTHYTDFRPSTITFLERACRWADFLRFWGVKSKNSGRTLLKQVHS